MARKEECKGIVRQIEGNQKYQEPENSRQEKELKGAKIQQCQCSREFKIPTCVGLLYLATKRPTATSAITAAVK